MSGNAHQLKKGWTGWAGGCVGAADLDRVMEKSGCKYEVTYYITKKIIKKEPQLDWKIPENL